MKVVFHGNEGCKISDNLLTFEVLVNFDDTFFEISYSLPTLRLILYIFET